MKVDAASGKPALVAHRGDLSGHPENTVPALEAALEAGVGFVEFDVQLTSDRVPVLLHDPDLQRVAGVPEAIAECSRERTRDVLVCEPGRLGADAPGAALPALSEVVDLLLQYPYVVAFAELKPASIDVFGVQTVVDQTLAALAPVRDRCVVISFDDTALVHARRSDQERIGWIAPAWDAESEQTAHTLNPEFMFADVALVPPAPVALWAGNWQWVVYEASTLEEVRRQHERGADLVESHYVTRVLDALAEERA